ncbi:uncharacterized protein DNG_10290 [Cephalotrichum gorgonifer]|uniref:Uncharacterized protein n=1 Tax=Cephalotrichum gorgonifer TaxID=2041049 RepID=A0AAE8N7B4_9PEZI|nr:uncharacterized protein DNG_10290 [Cephalotrichum gorgonifer]
MNQEKGRHIRYHAEN